MESLLHNRRRRVIVILFCFFAILQSGLRDIENSSFEGDDTPNYQSTYNEIHGKSWSDLCEHFSFYSSDYGERDGGYAFFVKATQFVYDDFRFFMFLTAAIFLIPLGIIIYKYVKSNQGLFLSFLIYFSLYINIVNCLMRQAVVLGVFLCALKFVKLHDWKRFYLILILLFTLHSSVIIAVPFYFITLFFSSRKWLLLALVAAPILTVCSALLMSHILVGSVYEHYGDSDSLGLVNLLLLIGFVSFLVYKYYDNIHLIKDYEFLICGVIGTLVCMPFIRMGGTLVRVSYYYFLLFIPLIPNVIDCVCKDRFVRRMAYVFSYCFFLFFLLR